MYMSFTGHSEYMGPLALRDYLGTLRDLGFKYKRRENGFSMIFSDIEVMFTR